MQFFYRIEECRGNFEIILDKLGKNLEAILEIRYRKNSYAGIILEKFWNNSGKIVENGTILNTM